jgi:hypothetical protein
MKRRRGSALIFVIGMLFATGVILMATAQVSMANERSVQAEQRIAEKENYVKGVEAWMTSESANNTVVMNTDLSLSAGGINYRANLVSTANPRVYRISNPASFTRFAYDFEIAGRQRSHPAYYAIWANGSLGNTTSALTISSADGSVHSNTNFRANASSVIQGDVTASGGASAIGFIGGNRRTGAPVQTTPLFDIADYEAVNVWDTFDGTQDGLLFINLGSPYPVFYYGNDLSIEGTYAGRGTLAINGNLTLSANSSYPGVTSRVVFIVKGNLYVDAACTSFVGTYIVDGNIIFMGSAAKTMTRGNLICSGNFDPQLANFNATADRAFWNDRTEAQKHRLPGFWPSAWTGIMR